MSETYEKVERERNRLRAEKAMLVEALEEMLHNDAASKLPDHFQRNRKYYDVLEKVKP